MVVNDSRYKTFNLYLLLLLISPLYLFADDFKNHLSLQGYTGLINTPNAQVIEEGSAVFQFNNQFDNHLRFYENKDSTASEESYIFGIGFLSSLEITGRLVNSEEPTFIRDLSASIKYKLPYEHEYLPNFAVGAQDIGSASSYYNNTYAVLDKEFWSLRTSIGYGKAGDNKSGKRMDGVFGGVEFQATDWLSVMAEHDGEENHVAMRLGIPNSILSSFNINSIITQNLTESATSFAVNIAVPLFGKEKIKRAKTEKKLEKERIDFSKKDSIQKVERAETSLSLNNKEKRSLSSPLELQKKLADFGFENVKVGSYGDGVIYVECENSIFDHNDLDALGYIIGSIVDSDLDYKYYTVTLLKSGLQTVSLGGSIVRYRNYLKDPTPHHLLRIKSNLVVTRDFDNSEVKFVGKKLNSSRFKPKVELSPGLVTTVGTEVGVLDYLVSLRANLYTSLYDGLIVSAMYESPMVHSNDFDDDKVYGQMYSDKLDSRLVNAGVHQTLHYNNILSTTSIGRFYTDYIGVMNQTNLASTSGNHALSMKLAFLDNRDSIESDERKVYLGTYRYLYEPFDLFGEVTYGQYWNQDRGFTLKLKRFFDDTEISFYYTKAEFHQYIGARVSFPLTFRKIAKASSFGQIKGKSDFNYGLRTTIRESDGSNRLAPSGGIVPKSDFELESYYLNRDRLGASYIKEHIERMRKAYLEYK
ncbi:YjbH domain-containing protein [Sulfurovum sp. bin170]|uniref:YjbH domain-containing protein n=1 Tax=Sulfurovum sp. bin170 TaxID=2695268 RepID=UPI0013DFF8F5|nr:YjbH domain-containing protein [Sulfurovum sp. bin170]